MAGINKAILVGNLGKDPEIRYSPNGLAVATFSLATTERYKDEDRTEWHKIVAFGRLAEICGEYLAKGKQVYIEGRIQTRDWEDRDGNKRYTTEIVANTMQMLGSAGGGGQRSSGSGNYRQGGQGAYGGQGGQGGQGGYSGQGGQGGYGGQGGQAGQGGQGGYGGSNGPNREYGDDYGNPPSDDDIPF